ncbi:TPA: murein biosynthesis integral membrane protein MurJ, partial [Pseudomonas aeruginosa]
MNLLKSLAAVSSITMLSRVLGFVRDTILARIFGAGLATDAFFVAFKLPNLLRRIFAEGAFSQAFVPILAEYKNQQGEEATRTFIAYVSGLLTLVLALVTALGILAAPWVIWVTAPGFADTPEKFALTTDLLRVTFPYILLISLSSLAGAILNTWNRFSVPAFVPTLLNVAMIGFALFLTPYFDPPVMVLGWAVLAGGLLQLLYQLPHLRKIGMLVLPRLNLRDSGVWRVMKLMLPAILGVSVSQISLIINTIFASFLAAGSVSWMYYADRLMELPSGVLGVALGTILLPMLAKTYSNKDRHEYSRLLDWGLRLCFLLVLPCSLALAILAEPLTVSLFQYGKFTTVDAAMTQRALVAYSVGLLGIILVKVLAPGFYAQQNIRTPVKIALFTLVSTQLMNLAFIGPLQHAGLALSIGLAACLNAGLLYWQLRKQRLYLPQPG